MAGPTPFDYVAYDDKAHAFQQEAKELFIQLHALLRKIGNKRVPYDVDVPSYQSVAAIKLEETYAFFGKQIRDDQIVRSGGKAPLQERRGKE
jgi:hypothetical protein